MKRSGLSRRGFALGALAGAAVTSACGNGIGSQGAAKIDARVDATLEEMFQRYPETRGLAEKASGMLVMPVVTEAGFWFGGAYGQGALRIGGTTVDYYSLTEGSWGLQIGAQQYTHALFFMTDEALTKFRQSSGWAAGGEVSYVFSDQGDGAEANTASTFSPVVAIVYGRGGIFLGASLEGNKYTRIIP